MQLDLSVHTMYEASSLCSRPLVTSPAPLLCEQAPASRIKPTAPARHPSQLSATPLGGCHRHPHLPASLLPTPHELAHSLTQRRLELHSYAFTSVTSNPGAASTCPLTSCRSQQHSSRSSSAAKRSSQHTHRPASTRAAARASSWPCSPCCPQCTRCSHLPR